MESLNLDKRNFSELLEAVCKKFEQNEIIYEPFVRSIRFPKFKALRSNTKISFTFPITVLVGVNGSNKTSVLQALYGVPANQSIGNYWFSTEVDKIDNKWKNSIIYSYYHFGAEKEVEAIKTRVSKDRLDYWEPSRPIKRYGMEIPTEEELINSGNRIKTRWDLIDKHVVFCDFKEYISAFDMYFYNYIFEKDEQYTSKQDFLRKRSAKLLKVVENDLESYVFGTIERVENNFIVSDEVKNTVSWMLDQPYEEIQIVSHKFYARKNLIRPLKTILMKKAGLNYTEAFAGSGESRLIMLVNDIVNAPEKSLILIDEPEINLHPSAILKFKSFLLNQVLKKNHQIVLSTHSHYLVSNLPKEAIKLFQSKNGEIIVTDNVDYNDAFLTLGESIDNKAKIIVEDRLAQAIVDFGIQKFNVNAMKDAITVEYVPGGVNTIIQSYIYISAMRGDTGTYYILDGDANQSCRFSKEVISEEWIEDEVLLSKNIPSKKDEDLGNIIKMLTGMEIKFNKNGGNVKNTELFTMQRRFIDYWATNVRFLNSTSPELAIIESKDNKIPDSITDGKEYFKKIANEKLGSEAKSEEILVVQKMEINSLKDDSPLRIHINQILTEIWVDINA